MSCEHVRSVLAGESPWVDVDDHLGGCEACRAYAAELDAVDALARTLPVPAPPLDLVVATLAAMNDETSNPETSTTAPLVRSTRARGGGPVWLRWGAGIGGLAAAALALVALLPAEQTADTSRMVERGVGERVPDVSLKVAVDQDGQLSRLSRERAYDRGDTLYFRAQVDADAWVALVRVDPQGVALVHQQQVTAGEADLVLDGGPLAWQIEPGETGAVFALLASNEPIGRSGVEAALATAYDQQDPGGVCRAVEPLGVRCSASVVKVTP